MASFSAGHDPANRETLNELKDLNQNLKKSIKASDRSGKINLFLSLVLFFLTFVQVILSIIDIYRNDLRGWGPLVAMIIFGLGVFWIFKKLEKVIWSSEEKSE